MTASKVVLDMDGVLIDSKTSLVTAYQRTCVELALPQKTMEFEVSLGGTLEGIFGTLYPLQSAESIACHFRDVSRDFPTTEFPGARELIDKLNSLGIPVDIVTNKDFERATKIADDLGFAVERIWSPSQGFQAKPHPEMLIRSIGDWPASEVFFVGDTWTDLMAAIAAGCSFVHAAWGYESRLNLPYGAMKSDNFRHLSEIIL
jgi:phosphoglycolate phosphatase